MHATGPSSGPRVLRYEEKSGYEGFVKQVLLQYPLLTASDYLEVHVSSSVEARRFADFMCETAPNVRIADDGRPAVGSSSAAQPSDPAPGPAPGPRYELVSAMQQMLRQHGVVDPFATGFELPKLLKISIGEDLGVSPERFRELEEAAFQRHFCAHRFSRNELLCVLFVLFKRLLSDPEIPSKLRKTDEELLYFLTVCRLMYKPQLPFHTFWHCVDVTQFTVYMLCTFDVGLPHELNACQRLALALAALGHDMLHSGLMTPVLAKWDATFHQRYGSLEVYHSHIFQHVLRQQWPLMIEHWEPVIREGILATELSKHDQYLAADLKSGRFFLHILKMSDFASAARFRDADYDVTSELIYREVSTQVRICAPFGISGGGFTLQESVAELQLRFLGHFVIPYFEWLVKQLPLLLPFLDCARGHYARFKRPLPM